MYKPYAVWYLHHRRALEHLDAGLPRCLGDLLLALLSVSPAERERASVRMETDDVTVVPLMSQSNECDVTTQ